MTGENLLRRSVSQLKTFRYAIASLTLKKANRLPLLAASKIRVDISIVTIMTDANHILENLHIRVMQIFLIFTAKKG